MRALRVFILAAVLLLPVQAMAGGLSGDQVQRFVASMKEVNVLGEEMEKAGKNEVLRKKMQPMEGEKFAPYTKSSGLLKTEFPDDYKKLGTVVSGHGFSSVEDWAGTADSVMHAYMANKMGEPKKQLEAAKAQMTPEMMAAMPPEAQAQMKQGMQMMEALSQVSQSDRDAVAQYTGQIDEMIKKAESAQAGK